MATHARGAPAARAHAQLVVGFECLPVPVGSAPGSTDRVAVTLRRVQDASVVRAARQRDRGTPPNLCATRLGVFPEPTQNPISKRAPGNAPADLHQFRVAKNARSRRACRKVSRRKR